MIIRLDTWCQPDCTLGRLTAGKFQCFTLELPWHGNSRSISCIPAGKYQVTHYISPTKGEVLLLHNVPNRSWIEIHAGNFTRQIEGCILVGDGIKYLDQDSIPDVTNSVITLNRLLTQLPNGLTLEITRTRSSLLQEP